MDHPNEELMREAIEFAQNHEYDTVGALIVKGDEIISIEGGTIFQGPDATGHSEINAIRKACEELDDHTLEGCWLYTTHEPCPMCAGAICWAKLEGVVYAAKDEDMPENWLKTFSAASIEDTVSLSDFTPEVHGEFLRDEAKDIGHE